MRGLATLARDDEARSTIDSWDIPWGSRLSGRGQTVTEDTAYMLSGVWACQTLIADAISTLPIDTYRKQGEVRLATTPPRWLNTPNPENSRIDYETQRIMSMLGWGNAYSLLIRQNGTADRMDPVIERWLLNPSTVSVRRTQAWEESSPLVYYVRGRQVPNGNIQHIRGYTRPGLFYGMSVITEAARGMGITLAAEQYGQAFYDQGVVPSGVLEVPALPAEVSKDVTDRLRDDFMSRNSGVNNAHKPMVLTGGTKWNQTMISPADAQFLEARKFELNEICRWYRVPPHKIQDIVAHASQGGGQGLEQQAGEFAKDTLLPWIVRFEEADSLLIPRGQFVRYNLNGYVRADFATRYAGYAQARVGGWLSVDDIRALEDLPPLPDGAGAVYLQPLNMAPAGFPGPAPAPPNSDQGAQ